GDVGGEEGLEVANLTLRVRAVAVAHRGHDLAGLRLVGIEARHVLAQNLFGRVPERASRAVVVEDDDALAIDGDNDVRRVLEQLLEVDGGEAGDGLHAGWNEPW